MDYLYYALAVAVVLFVGVTIFKQFVEKPIITILTHENFADAPTTGSEGGAGGDYKFVMFGVDWCPHCVKAKPEFQALGPKQTIAGRAVDLQVINPETEENPYKEKVKISGYPTVVLLDAAGNTTEYEGPRSTQGFQDFLAEKVQ
jgi:thiol-disulfide isomerase/thioredoxin